MSRQIDYSKMKVTNEGEKREYGPNGLNTIAGIPFINPADFETKKRGGKGTGVAEIKVDFLCYKVTDPSHPNAGGYSFFRPYYKWFTGKKNMAMNNLAYDTFADTVNHMKKRVGLFVKGAQALCPKVIQDHIKSLNLSMRLVCPVLVNGKLMLLDIPHSSLIGKISKDDETKLSGELSKCLDRADITLDECVGDDKGYTVTLTYEIAPNNMKPGTSFWKFKDVKDPTPRQPISDEVLNTVDNLKLDDIVAKVEDSDIIVAVEDSTAYKAIVDYFENNGVVENKFASDSSAVSNRRANKPDLDDKIPEYTYGPQAEEEDDTPPFEPEEEPTLKRRRN